MGLADKFNHFWVRIILYLYITVDCFQSNGYDPPATAKEQHTIKEPPEYSLYVRGRRFAPPKSDGILIYCQR